MPAWLVSLIAQLFPGLVTALGELYIKQMEKPQSVQVDTVSQADAAEYEEIFGTPPGTENAQCETETLHIVKR